MSTVIDLETFGIDPRPDYPPMPVGVAVKPLRARAKYYAFGHREGNNCCWSDAVAAVRQAYAAGPTIFQNAKFDLEVIERWFGLPVPDWQQVHDTLFLLYLDDPHQTSLSLKPAAERLLDLPPAERDAVEDWLVQHQPVPGIKISRSKQSPHYAGRYICLAPGNLVGQYAIGDVERTAQLFQLLHPRILDRGMAEAYDRERQLLPILLRMEQQGLPVDLPRLSDDVTTYRDWAERLDQWLLRRLGDGVNLDSGGQLFQALRDHDLVDLSKALLTKTGKYQTNQQALLRAVIDPQVTAVLTYRARLKTCLRTFMQPWLATATRSSGLIYTSWHQVRGEHKGGTRTGRLSSHPNFQNIPTSFDPLFQHESDDPQLPTSPLRGLPPLPRVRSYVVPFEGEVLIDRDYSQQEPRILAHFAGGTFMQQYLDDPWVDFHDATRDALAAVGKHYDRKPVKITNLGVIYGQGIGSLAEMTGLTVTEAQSLKRAIMTLYPGLRQLYNQMKQHAQLGKPIYTWGGREYYCEPPRIVDGRIRQFDYKLVNVQVQGSAAECTKQAIINFDRCRRPSWRLLLNVHDQLTVSVPAAEVDKAMAALRKAMEAVQFNVPILSEGKVSTTNWDQLTQYDRKGVLCQPTYQPGPSADTTCISSARSSSSSVPSTESVSRRTKRWRAGRRSTSSPSVSS